MKKIFIGLLFLFININLNQASIIPGYIGCVLIYLGLAECVQPPSYGSIRTVVLCGAIGTALAWGMALMGSVSWYGGFFRALVTYCLVRWAEKLAPVYGWDSELVGKFRTAWYVLLAGEIVAFLFALMLSGLALVAAAIIVVAAIYYIYIYYQLWKSAKEGTPGNDHL